MPFNCFLSLLTDSRNVHFITSLKLRISTRLKMTVANIKHEESKKSFKKNRILESLNCLFYGSKLFGVIPYSLNDYIMKKKFELSSFGSIFCVVSCIIYISNYHILITNTMFEKDSEAKIGTLTIVIGIFIIYLEPFMMSIDVISSIINQTSLIDVLDRLQDIDIKLERENVFLNYRAIKRFSIIFIFVALIGEMSLGIMNVIIFQEEISFWESIWWFVSCFPLFVNGLARTWFLILIMLVQQRLRAINSHLNDIKKSFNERKIHCGNNIAVGRIDINFLRKDNLFIDTVGYLEKEICSTTRNFIKNTNGSDTDQWNWARKAKTKNGNINMKRIIQVAPAKGKNI